MVHVIVYSMHIRLLLLHVQLEILLLLVVQDHGRGDVIVRMEEQILLVMLVVQIRVLMVYVIMEFSMLVVLVQQGQMLLDHVVVTLHGHVLDQTEELLQVVVRQMLRVP